MKTIYVISDDDGFVQGVYDALIEGMQDIALAVEVDDDFDIMAVDDYRLKDGKLVYTGEGTAMREEMDAEAEVARAMEMQRSTALSLFVQTAELTDEQALTVSTMYPEWSDGSVEYKERTSIVRYGGHLYRCAKNHTSSEQNNTSVASLWTKIDKAGDGVDVWQQPSGAHDAYNKGDRVHYPDADGPIYVSQIDGNTWSPDSYPDGWKLEGGSE